MSRGERIRAHNAIVSHEKPVYHFGNGRFQTKYQGNFSETKARYVAMVNGGASQRAACRELGVGRSNLRQWLEDDSEFAAAVAG